MNESVVVPEITAVDLEKQISLETTRLSSIRGALSSVAIESVYQKTILQQAAKKLSEAAGSLLAQAEALAVETREPFGGEESYWTLFRMFVTADNVNQLRTLDEIWDILAKNYDMTAETNRSLIDTLQMFKDDIVTDAAERGYNGTLDIEKHGVRFICHDTPVVELAVAPALTILEATPPVESEVVTKDNQKNHEADERVFSMDEMIKRSILSLLAGQPEAIMKQSELKKVLVKQGSPLTFDQLQTTINSLVDTAQIFKFKKDAVSFLSSTLRLDEKTIEPIPSSSDKELLAINNNQMAIAEKILTVLTAPGTHVQQSTTMSELWRKIRDNKSKSQPIPEGELEVLKTVCRQLGSLKILDVGSAPKGTSGTRTRSATSSKRRRSSSQEVFKAKLISQNVKKEIQEAIELGLLDEYIGTQIENLGK